MTLKQMKCKRCKTTFIPQHFNQEYCKEACFKESRQEYRREYMREYMAKRRETLTFLLEDAINDPDDRIKVAYFGAPGLHDFVHEIAKDHNVIALQISGNEVGVVIATDASEEE